MLPAPTALEHVVASSSQLTTWALAVLAGSIALIVSASYHRPKGIIKRLPYVFFLFGWIEIARSLHAGDGIVGAYLASLIADQAQAAAIPSDINDYFDAQRRHLLSSLVCFGLWLVYYLFAWMLIDNFFERAKQ